MKCRPAPPLRVRFLASSAGIVYLLSIVCAQIGLCRCGEACPHDAQTWEKQRIVAVLPAAHACCPPRAGADEPPKPQTPRKHSNGCPCSGQIKSADRGLSAGVLPVVWTSVDSHAGLSVHLASDAVAAVARDSQNAFASHAIRGSPFPRPPLHLLNSVFLI